MCLYAKTGFEKFARLFSRRHKQTTFSDAGFFFWGGGVRVFFFCILRVKMDLLKSWDKFGNALRCPDI